MLKYDTPICSLSIYHPYLRSTIVTSGCFLVTDFYTKALMNSRKVNRNTYLNPSYDLSGRLFPIKISRAAEELCSFLMLQKTCQKLLQRSDREQKLTRQKILNMVWVLVLHLTGYNSSLVPGHSKK